MSSFIPKVAISLQDPYDPGDAPSWNVPAWNPNNSGSSGNPITFKCLSGGCTLTHNTVGPAIGATNKNYITWDGFKGTKVSNQPMVIFNSQSYGTIKNCNFTGYDWLGDNNSIIRNNIATFVLVQNNYLF